jgi:hypothetical protein
VSTDILFPTQQQQIADGLRAVARRRIRAADSPQGRRVPRRYQNFGAAIGAWASCSREREVAGHDAEDTIFAKRPAAARLVACSLQAAASGE